MLYTLGYEQLEICFRSDSKKIFLSTDGLRSALQVATIWSLVEAVVDIPFSKCLEIFGRRKSYSSTLDMANWTAPCAQPGVGHHSRVKCQCPQLRGSQPGDPTYKNSYLSFKSRTNKQFLG